MLDSAEYRALALATFNAAAERLEKIARKRGPGAAPWVVVMDADETLLNNLQFQVEGKKLGVKYTPPRWREWVARRQAGAVPGAAGFLSYVLALGGKVAIITNRDDDQAIETAENMAKLGMSTDAAQICILGLPRDTKAPPNGNNKDARLVALRNGKAEACWKDKGDAAEKSWAEPQDVVMQIGDSVQDFPAITQREAAALPEVVAEHLGLDWFLVPNAAYGSWEEKTPEFWIRPVKSDIVTGWANLSGLAADPADPNILYAVTDRASPPPRILRIDVSSRPPKVLDAIDLDTATCGADLDLEGIAIRDKDQFWLVSEGGKDNQRTNLLLEVDRAELCLRRVSLPESERDKIEDRGLEGVTLDENGNVYVAFQSPLKDETDTRIGKFDPTADQSDKAWSFFYYPLETVDGARIGLSELLSLGDNRFAAIERDDQEGGHAKIKWITTFELPPPDAGALSKVKNKKRAVNLIDYFERDHRKVEEQIEGLAITSRGGVFVVTDDDASQETLLLYLGTTGDTKLKR